MTPTAAPARRPFALPAVSPRALLKVARLDAVLLYRNRTALFTVFGLPLMFTGMLVPMRGQDIEGVDGALLQGTGHLAFFLIFAVFMNMVNVYTTRREDRTLKRLRGTALSDADVLGGGILTATVMYLVQAVFLLVMLATVFGGGLPANPLLLLVGLAGGVAVFALLGFAISGLTPNAELAQLTVLPIMFGCMLGGGVMFPLDALPDAVHAVCRWLPLTPIVEIVRTAYFGQDFAGSADHPAVGFVDGWVACAQSFAALIVWLALGREAAKRWFRWEPRHG